MIIKKIKVRIRSQNGFEKSGRIINSNYAKKNFSRLILLFSQMKQRKKYVNLFDNGILWKGIIFIGQKWRGTKYALIKRALINMGAIIWEPFDFKCLGF